jgi:hypothetical protein
MIEEDKLQPYFLTVLEDNIVLILVDGNGIFNF